MATSDLDLVFWQCAAFEMLLVTGVKELGIWDATRAKQMFSSDGKTWTIKLELMPHREIEYKYIRIFSGGDKSWVVWEKGPNSGNRKFYWNGVTVSQDDGLISSFEENKELQTEPYAFAESQELGAGAGRIGCDLLPEFLFFPPFMRPALRELALRKLYGSVGPCPSRKHSFAPLKGSPDLPICLCIHLFKLYNYSLFFLNIFICIYIYYVFM